MLNWWYYCCWRSWQVFFTVGSAFITVSLLICLIHGDIITAVSKNIRYCWTILAFSSITFFQADMIMGIMVFLHRKTHFGTTSKAIFLYPYCRSSTYLVSATIISMWSFSPLLHWLDRLLFTGYWMMFFPERKYRYFLQLSLCPLFYTGQAEFIKMAWCSLPSPSSCITFILEWNRITGTGNGYL